MQGPRRGVIVVVLMLAMGMLAGAPASAQEEYHDPTEPPRDAASFDAAPSPRLSLADGTFGAVPHLRTAGDSRYATAVEASRAGWPSGAGTVVIAPGDTFQDALSASSLAGATRAPLLLATASGLDTGTLAELERLAPTTVHLVGDLADTVATQAGTVTDEVVVVAGHNVHETSAEAGRAAIEAGGDGGTLVVASAASFADSLTSSALAAGLKAPLLLVGVEGMADWVGARAREFGTSTTLVVGGTSVIPDQVVAQAPGVVRLAGSTRYETMTAVADHLRAAGFDGPPVLASGASFADGLAGGVLAALSHRAPLLLTDVGLSDTLVSWLTADQPEWVRIMGGPAAVSPLAACQLQAGDTRAFLCVEEELLAQGYNVGTVDGQVDHQTVWMTYAFQKVAGLPVTGDFGEAEFAAMLTRPRIAPAEGDYEPDRVEVNIGEQLVLVVRDGEVVRQFHTSTGKPSTPTVRGVWRVYEKRNYRQANHMYRPVFFYRGYAFHGYPSVPLYPASHGCARMYDHDMDVLWDYLYMGEQIVTYL